VSTSSLAENQELNSAARGAGTGDFWVGLVSKTGLRTTKRANWMWLSTQVEPDFDGWTKMNPSPDNFQGKQGLVARVNPDGGWGKSCIEIMCIDMFDTSHATHKCSRIEVLRDLSVPESTQSPCHTLAPSCMMHANSSHTNSTECACEPTIPH
jgi:hypothetical protein